MNGVIDAILARDDDLFTNGMHIQMLINRAKNNTNKGSKRWINKLISFDKKQYQSNCIMLLDQMRATGDPDIRLYASINPRSLDRASKQFLSNAILKGNKLFWRNTHEKFISSAMQPEQRERTLWLIDVDDKSLIPKVDELLVGSYVAFSYETPQGKHYIVSHVDMRPFKEMQNVDIHRDGLMLLHTYSAKA